MGSIPWNKGKSGSQIPWNKGLTKKNDPRIASYAKTLSVINAGKCPQYTITESHRQARRKRMLGERNPAKRSDVSEKIRETLLRTYKENPSILENRKPSGLNQFSSNYTSIEAKIAHVLSLYGIPFEHNRKVGRYFPDFIIFGNIIIECDGEYWHEDEVKESVRDEYLHDQGYYIFHLSGQRIMKDPVECVNMVIITMQDLDHRSAAGFQCQELPFSLA